MRQVLGIHMRGSLRARHIPRAWHPVFPPVFGAAHVRNGIRFVMSLPQIPGVVLVNAEIPNDRLVTRIRKWAANSPSLRGASNFDVLQLAEYGDGQLAPRAICGIQRTHLRLSGSSETLPAVVALFYRAREYLNQEFWEDQVRRLCDIVADEYLAGRRGVQLMVHHKVPQWAMGLEIGDHRLLAEVGVLHLAGLPRAVKGAARASEVVLCTSSDRRDADAFHRLGLSVPGCAEDLPGSALLPGTYVARCSGGESVCGVRVLGVLPWRLICSEPWCSPEREADLAALVYKLCRRAGRLACSVLGDSRDAEWTRLCGTAAAPRLGTWQAQGRTRIAITGAPVGLAPEEQVALARAPLAVPWEFLPFHAGSILLT